MTTSPKTPQPLHAKKHNFSGLLTLVSLGLVIAGTIGLVLLRKPLTEQSQDIRNDASVSDGKVTVKTSPSYGSSFTVNQPITLEFKVNTNGVQTDGLQLTYYVEGTNLTIPTVEFVSGTGLVNTTKQVQTTDNGYKVSLLALPNIGQPFSTTNDTTFAKATFTSSQVGTFSIDFDESSSIATVYESDPVKDELKNIASGNYQVVAASVASPTPTPTPGVSPTPTPTPTPTPGTGGSTTKACNETCTSNTQCGMNNFCNAGRCRLVTNPTSTTCTNPPDQGLDFSCNEYCANTGECAGGYTCLSNRCRRADNPDDALCRLPSNKTQQRVAAGCNKSCSSNAGCAANLRCYQGSCRLAVNPTSPSCSAADPLKGGGEDEQQPDDATSESSQSSTGSSVARTSPRPSPTASVTGDTEESTTTTDQADWVTNLRNRFPLRLIAVLAVALGAFILALLLVPRLLRRRPSGSGPVTAAKPTPASNSEYEKELQAKLNALKQQQTTPVVTAPVTQAVPAPTATPVVAPPSAMMTPPPRPAAPPVTTEPRPEVTVPPKPMPTVQARPAFVEPTPTAQAAPVVPPTAVKTETPVFDQSSSMMARIREKGINPPASDATSDQS